ncbi:MAG TPA: hypothetical protein VN112_19305 [Ensifer sp.]|nr:hypothetical protein [Ensifer sp.]
MSDILTAELVGRAFAVIRPAVEATLRAEVTDRRALALVVTTTDALRRGAADDATDFQSGCLLVTSIGDLSRSPYPNLEIALKKAEMSARTGLPTAQMPAHYLRSGDTIFWGSAVLNGIVVACAGLEPRHDEMFSHWFAATIQAEARLEFERRIGASPDSSFLL